jgi:hypothetical protein
MTRDSERLSSHGQDPVARPGWHLTRRPGRVLQLDPGFQVSVCSRESRRRR